MRFQLAAARLALCTLVLGALCVAAAVLGVRQGLFSYARGLEIMILATGLGLAAFAGSFAWLVSALRRNQGEGRRIGLIALVGALLLLWPPLSTLYHRLTAPAIHDATTDTENPPRFVALLKLRGPGANSPVYDGTAQIHYRGEDGSINYMLHTYFTDVTKPHSAFLPNAKHPVATLFWRAFEAAKRMGWSIVDYSERDGRIEATDASFWFGRVSDIVIRVTPAGMGARTDMRAQSRDDALDDGANAALIKRFFKKMN